MALTRVRKRELIKISLTLPDDSVLEFRETDIIRCVVSLRSDLSVVNSTIDLPVHNCKFDMLI